MTPEIQYMYMYIVYTLYICTNVCSCIAYHDCACIYIYTSQCAEENCVCSMAEHKQWKTCTPQTYMYMHISCTCTHSCTQPQ